MGFVKHDVGKWVSHQDGVGAALAEAVEQNDGNIGRAIRSMHHKKEGLLQPHLPVLRPEGIAKAITLLRHHHRPWADALETYARGQLMPQGVKEMERCIENPRSQHGARC